MPNCQRCGCHATGTTSAKPDARMLRRATTGVCIECAVAIFIQRLSNMYVPGAFRGLPESLRLPHIQGQFAAMMRAGNAEASQEEVDWDRVIEVWSIEPAAKETLF